MGHFWQQDAMRGDGQAVAGSDCSRLSQIVFLVVWSKIKFQLHEVKILNSLDTPWHNSFSFTKNGHSLEPEASVRMHFCPCGLLWAHNKTLGPSQRKSSEPTRLHPHT